MYLHDLGSDQWYTWSDESTERATGRLAKTPRVPSAPTAPAPIHPAWVLDRALQTMRQTRMQMRRRTRSWPQVLSVGKLPRPTTANGLRATRVVRANRGVPGQLSSSPRNLRGDLRDQPRTAAPSRGALKNRCERATGCPSHAARSGDGRRVARQYACRLARRQSKFCGSGGSQ